MSNDVFPDFKNYNKYSDKSITHLNHGGIAAYVDKTLALHVFDVTFNGCFISLRRGVLYWSIFG